MFWGFFLPSFFKFTFEQLLSNISSRGRSKDTSNDNNHCPLLSFAKFQVFSDPLSQALLAGTTPGQGKFFTNAVYATARPFETENLFGAQQNLVRPFCNEVYFSGAVISFCAMNLSSVCISLGFYKE